MVHVKCRPSGERSCCSLDLSAERYEARYLEQDFHNPAYRKTLLRSFAVATVAAVLWKIGPLSEATIGHVGPYSTVDKWGYQSETAIELVSMITSSTRLLVYRSWSVRIGSISTSRTG